jgi:hypothetical protein
MLVRWLENGSFAFTEGMACAVREKANVPFVGGNRNSIFFEVGKKSKTQKCRQ